MLYSSAGSPHINEVEVGLLEREAAEGSESLETTHTVRGSLAPGRRTSVFWTNFALSNLTVISTSTEIYTRQKFRRLEHFSLASASLTT